ncbi:MAG TPA: BatD family protein, partial [Clostridia bacterium]|nr:BatD family protein [Clostridia bacterium]
MLLAATLLSLQPAWAQPTSAPPAQDPLMMLMLSQPRIEVDGPVTATAVFDPPVVRPGDTAVYRVVLNALEASIEWPGEIPAEEALHLRAGGRGQILQMSATNMQPRTTYLYRARPDTLGRFVIPEYTIQAYGKEVTVPETSLEVTPRPPTGVAQAQGLLLELPG